MGYSKPNSSFIEEQQWYYLTGNWRDKGVHAFPKSINPKVNIIVWLEFELSYFEVTVQHINPHTMGL